MVRCRYDWLIFIVCIAISLTAGEFTAFTGFNLFGYHVLPPMVLTKSLPFLLLGRIIGEWRMFLFRIRSYIYYLLVPILLFFSAVEIFAFGRNGLLATTSYTVSGMLAAFCLCVATIKSERVAHPVNFFVNNFSSYVKVFYATHQPVGFLCFIVFQMFFASFYSNNMMLAVVIMLLVSYAFSICVGMLIAFAKSLKDKKDAELIHNEERADNENSDIKEEIAMQAEPINE